MKTKIFILFFILLGFGLFANDIIPNRSFENWTSKTVEFVENYPHGSHLNSYYSDEPSNVEKVTDAYHGQYAVKLTTVAIENEKQIGYFMNTDARNGDMNAWVDGFPYTEKPTGIRGYYKYNVASSDSALIVLSFRKTGVGNIGNYPFRIGGIKTEYTLFDLTLTPALTQTPDSIIFAVVSSDFFRNNGGLVGSTLQIDNVSLTGVTSQPALFNGDFENWSTISTPLVINNWNPDRGSQQDGISRTTDAKDGMYAMELTSYVGGGNGIPRNQPGYLTTGYWNNTCNCSMGGIPFTNLIDTLTFWYKYTPTVYNSQTDWASIYLNIQKNGAQINWTNKNLNAASDFQYVEIPFDNNNQVPDSLIINFISSDWQNTNINFAGSKLIIDKLQFKSEMISSGIQQLAEVSLIDIYPTVSNAVFKLINPNQVPVSLDVYNSTGIKMSHQQGLNTEINLKEKPSGIYFVRISVNNRIVTKRILKL
ncbi:MAG: T9SS type A sorting domain-containing protein [Paludibacter sp.]|nr:T9SS type A sorting domain-containing protein [Paludibacter sp.]